MEINIRRVVSAATAVAVGAALAVGLPGVSQAQPSCSSIVRAQPSSTPRVLATDNCVMTGRTVQGAHAAATVPPPGRSVTVNALLVNGEETLNVSTAADGAVTVSSSVPSASASAPRKTAPNALPPCSDGANALLNYSYGRGGNYYWYYAAADDSRSGLSTQDAENAIVNATRAITQGYNDCGWGGQPNVNQTYGGRIGVGPNISGATNGCTTGDGWSITGWGSMTGSILAVTCTWSSGGIVTTSDMMANYNYRWWNGAGGCPNNNYAFDLEGVTTHERGHTFGLGHPPDGHDNETMSAYLNACTTQYRTLALGDYNAMISLYGYR